MKLTELQAITPEQLLRMNKTQLQSAVKELNKHVNRRMKKLERAGIEQQSPAYRSIQKSGGTLKSDVNLNQLRREFARGQRFINQKTSTPTGVRQARTNMFKGIKKSAGGGTSSTLSDKQYDVYEKAVARLEEMYPNLRWQKYEVQEKMKEYVQEHPKTNWYHVFQAGKRELDRLYDELEQRERQIINELFESEAELVE